MADKRKLQGEMDRCFKKIQEGVETFEDIWQKLYSANNTNQKDKYESDLKKEIKKLQRLRDQVKTWAASNEIKDKDTLLSYRKLIETQMEKFKIVERETKTKAYSKEGLGAAAKVDPAQKEKEETEQWLQSMITALNLKLDMAEGEIETCSSLSRKRKMDRDKQERIEELKTIANTHRFHLQYLECLLRMLDNETITSDKINLIRDDLDYYLEACEDPDYEHNEFLYSDMGLNESVVSKGVAGVTTNASPTESNQPTTAGDETEPLTTVPVAKSESVVSLPKEDENRPSKRSPKLEDTPKKAPPTSTTTSSSRNGAISRATTSTAVPVTKPTIKTSTTHMVSTSQPYAAAAAHQNTNLNSPSQVTKTTHSTPTSEVEFRSVPSASQPNTYEPRKLWNINNHYQASTDDSNADIQNTVNSIVTSVESMNISPSLINDKLSPNPENEDEVPITTTPMVTNQPINGALVGTSPPPMSPPNAFDNGTNRKPLMQTSVMPPLNRKLSSSTFDRNSSDLSSISAVVKQEQSLNQQSINITGIESRVTPLQGVAPLGTIEPSKENHWQKVLTDSCYRHMPHPSDSERQRHYLPRNPCMTPHYYPQAPIPLHDSLEFYLRLSTESLFFIFYYMEASKAQYMAAKALKKQSWRFHTKYMMWFQRHEEPKTITDEYEQGTYIYFDYEKWGQRKKEGFTFEYRFLEDRELQ